MVYLQDWETVRAAFQSIWGYEDFRFPQGKVIRTLLARRDALVVMPTGGGKSVCFQLPALLQTGLTLVVSPLVALMENQVQELRQRQLPAALLHSELPAGQRRQVFQNLERQQLRLLYLSPETLLSKPVWQCLCQPQLQVNGLMLDEAHCLVQWGETFRPAYRRIGEVRPALLQHKPAGSQFAIAAFTATADPRAQQVIQSVLKLKQPEPVLLSPYRANLRIKVQTVFTPRGRRQRLLKFIQARSRQSGLVYVRSRQDSETFAAWFRQQNLRAAAYHAGLSPSNRRRIETDWLNNRLQFVVCTSAFGMGINKPDVRFVAHLHPPLLLSEYVQEIGRAGRDGRLSQILLLASEPTGWLDPEDRQRQAFFEKQLRSQQQMAQSLSRRLPPQGEVAAIAKQFREGEIALALLHSAGQLAWQGPFHYQIQPAKSSNSGSQLERSSAQTHPKQLAAMKQFITTQHCRWRFLLHHFGFKPSAKFRCDRCDNCLRRQR